MDLLPHNKLLDLTGKTAIVTGGAVGIGYGISYRLAEAGANVVIADINQANAEKTQAEFAQKGWKAKATRVDVSKEADVHELMISTVTTYGGIDILVNNAGIFPSITLANLEPIDFDRIIAVNLRGVYLCTKAASTQMIKQGKGGSIINVTSVDALHPSSIGLATYDASKHGVWGFTKNVALELSQHKIWVNAVAPGGIVTPGVAEMSKKAPAGVDMNKVMEAFMAKIPMHRMGEPDEIGKAVLFLASPMSSYMTGTQIVVDGGALLS